MARTPDDARVVQDLCHQRAKILASLVYPMTKLSHPMDDMPHFDQPSVFRIGMVAQILNGAHPGRRARRLGFVPPKSETFRYTMSRAGHPAQVF
jgi:hypothetical protein